MRTQVLANKVVVAESVFEPSEYARIEDEIAALRPKIEPTYHESDVTLYRAVLDTLYPDRKQSYILQAIQTKLYSDELIEQVSQVQDLSYTLMNKQHKFRTFLTEMRDDTDYRTHTDTGDTHDWTQIFMSWIWYYNPRPKAFTGGQLKVVDLDLSIDPKDNRLVLLPSYLRHQITPAKYAEPNYYRTTVNGFLTWAGPSQSAASDTQIERALAGGPIVGSHLLPEPNGHLGQVRHVTAALIAKLEQLQLGVGDAATLLRRGDTAFRAGQYRDAYARYRDAYQAAVAGSQ